MMPANLASASFSRASHAPVWIVDFGSQVTQLIARRLRELGFRHLLIPSHAITDIPEDRRPRAIILSGGPSSVYDSDAPRLDPAILSWNIPIFGICYGQQWLCQSLGGSVAPAPHREYGAALVDISMSSPLTQDAWGAPSRQPVWMSHGDRVEALPPGWVSLGQSEDAPFAVAGDVRRRYYGVQFHPEVVHTPEGTALLASFLEHVAGLEPDWTVDDRQREQEQRCEAYRGRGTILCAVSGGVDSTVATCLLHRILPDQVRPIAVDTGLLRKDEMLEVRRIYEALGIPLRVVDASDLFFDRLAGVTDPEAKRKIIGASFIEVFDQEAAREGRSPFLMQGTLYPDVIESAAPHGGASVTIKSHHNVGGLPEHMQLELIEPLRDFFKDEVRVLGRSLGIPEDFLARHPFPGPGLSIRIMGEVTRERVALLQEVDAVFLEVLRETGWHQEIWQAFAVLLPVQTVGVMGDGRTYESVVALRAVTSVDGMTAEVGALPFEVLKQASGRIINRVRGVGRVVYDITSKPPATIEWE